MQLSEYLEKNIAFEPLIPKTENQRIELNYLPNQAKPAFISLLAKKTERPIFLIASNSRDAAGLPIFPDKEFPAVRTRMLWEKPKLMAAPIKAVLFKTSRKIEALALSEKKEIEIDVFLKKLENLGYSRREIVGESGEYAVRGGIVDVFSVEPIRIEFVGEQIESIRYFDAASQRSIRKIAEATILPAIEREEVPVFDHLDKETIIFWDEPLRIKLMAERVLDEHKEEGLQSFAEIEKMLSRFRVIENNPLKEGIKIAIPEELLPKDPGLIKLPRPAREGINRDLLLEIKENDFVVHENYGIGIYRGMRMLEVDRVVQEYLLLEYAGKDQLYVPLQQTGLIEKYSGGVNPKVYRLSGKEWGKTRERVEKGLENLTRDLLMLYAARKHTPGFAFPTNSAADKELADTFPYEETADQKKAIAEIMRDMESDQPMDRLICGDVGYGKTEVAVRAVFKAAMAGKQAAILAPTTILAEQHFSTFSERLKPYPIKIAVLSRFIEKKEQKQIIEKLANHEIDVVIGTHRLLQKDVVFPELGLLVVDEEHRFGVAHKEKIKQLKKYVDVITLTATPIPRTLYFSLSGAREMSLISTPPLDRLPIRTHVVPYDKNLVKEVIERELDRGGQIFYVHNYVQTIEKTARRLKELLPDAKIEIAHGQMREDRLAKTMTDFLERKFDVLVCTTIIESGLDITNANTMLIDHAEKFGLAQLYQLRGRIGRSDVRAYAYLLYNRDDVATKEALSRLSAIQEFSELGSGYRLALRDLEIRGAGTLLGARQHGHIMQVGFDMYCDLLEEAVRRAKGIETPVPRQVVVDLKVSAYIPSDYISDERQRGATYRRLAVLSEPGGLKEIKEEIRDRFGKIPTPLDRLFEIIGLKIHAQALGIKIIKEEKSRIYIEWFSGKHKLIAKPQLEEKDKVRWIKTLTL